MATTYEVFPAIGIARLGTSVTDFFIGPLHSYHGRFTLHLSPNSPKEGKCGGTATELLWSAAILALKALDDVMS